MSDLLYPSEDINYTENAETPKDEGRTNWHMRLRREAANEATKIKALFAAEIAALQARQAELLAPLDNTVAWHDAAIDGWHRAMHADGTVGLKVSLPHGTSKIGDISKSLEVTDPEALDGWIGSLDDPSTMKLDPKPVGVSKAAVKAALTILDESLVEPGALLELVEPDTGEVVPGVAIRCSQRTRTTS